MKRQTIQRTLILDAVTQLKNHPTADQVYSEIHAKHPTISRGTVYRNLNKLAESGEILMVEIPGGASIFDFNTSNHYHAKCIRCGCVVDVDMEAIPNLLDKIGNKDEFEFLGYDIAFRGICSNCKRDKVEDLA